MTVEIKELIVQVRVNDTLSRVSAPQRGDTPSWERQQLLEQLKQEILDYLAERGRL